MQPKIYKIQPKIGRMQPVEIIYLSHEEVKKMNLADNLKKIRKDNNLSQEDLADKLGVSRQSVSKWESGQAYPEMDKVLQICKLFNLNINDLLNEDINEVKEKKESNNKINKYIDDFLDFITKTVKLFNALRLRDKIKLLFEQFIYIMIGIISYFIIGNVLADIFSFLYNIGGYHQIVFSILKCVYSVVFLVIFLIIFIHIFKVRYLDYYEIKDRKQIIEEESAKEETTKADKKEIIVNKEPKIIIRDEKNSSYSFIKALVKVIVFFIKICVFFMLLGVISAFISIVVAIVLTFLIRKNGLLFFGLFTGGIGALLISGVIIYMMYYFIVNKKIKYKVSGIILLISFILCGIGIGLSIISIKDLKIQGLEGDLVEKYETTIPMKDDLYMEDDYYFYREYVEEKRKDIYIETYIVDTEPIEVEVIDNKIVLKHKYINRFGSINNELVYVKKTLNDLNNKKVYKYTDYKVVIHASKENIQKMEENHSKMYPEEIIEDEEKEVIEE